MFGKSKETAKPTSTRYKVESFHSAGKTATLVAGLEDLLNAGEDKDWKLVFMTQHAGAFFVTWDTNPV